MELFYRHFGEKRPRTIIVACLRDGSTCAQYQNGQCGNDCFHLCDVES